MQKDKRTRSVFHTIMLPMLVLLLVEIALLVAAVKGNHVMEQLNQNAEDILQKQVESRAGYLNSAFMNWMDLSRLQDKINSVVQEMLDDGAISLDKLDSDSEMCAPVVKRVADKLVSMLYAKRLTGIYLVFNTEEISADGWENGLADKTGIYIRDMDPLSAPSARSEDLLLEYAPISVVQSLTISTDKAWQPRFAFSEMENAADCAFFLKPLSAVYADTVRREAEDYAYWGPSAFTALGASRPAVTYSLPLMLEDGTVYGVLGVDLLESYLQAHLPYEELSDDDDGVYFLAVAGEKADALTQVTPMFSCGEEDGSGWMGGPIDLSAAENGYRCTVDGEAYVVSAVGMSLYNRNAAYDGERWVLLGAVPSRSLYAFPRRIILLLILDVAGLVLVGIAGSFLISRKLSRPIRRLSREVAEAHGSERIPHLSQTGIRELDQFSGAFGALGREAVNASARFSRIIQLASVELGGFELCQKKDSVYVTENLLPMLGLTGEDAKDLTASRFAWLIRGLDETCSSEREPDGSILYCIKPEGGKERYIRLNVTDLGDCQVGIAEDATAATLERLRVEHERDYDLLTGLLNRRAFYARAEELFAHPEQLGHAAMMMLDLDNLKYINDHYGHDYGDKYIRQAGLRFLSGSPEGTLCSRVSGDEFFLLFYGYATRDELRGVLNAFFAASQSKRFELPNGEETEVGASAGVAWYPEDATDFRELMKFADFAMYQVKHAQKGRVGEFDLGVYNQESFMAKARGEFFRFLQEERVSYYMQPIVDARTGEVFAYEALMRTDLPTLHSTETILKIAREEKRLQEIECLTWVNTLAAYRRLLEKGQVREEALLFVNSIGSQTVTPEVQEYCEREYGDLHARVVVEITESDDLTQAAIAAKREASGGVALFAMDDYGSGYNNERTLLELCPQFIKIDNAIIRRIDADVDKQQIVAGIVEYAHQRGMRIVAEGVETAAELRRVIELGVDLLQGYLLAQPSTVPAEISPEAVKIIREMEKEREKERQGDGGNH